MKQTFGFAAFLSLILPGFGQLIKGDVPKAFLIWGGYIAIFFSSYLTNFVSSKIVSSESVPILIVSIIITSLPFLSFLVLWIWQIRDAYLSKAAP